MTPSSVLIVGAGLAGSRCADTLRARGYAGRITLVGAEPDGPYERPALSKELLLGERDRASLALRPQTHWADSGIELALGCRVDHVDFGSRTALAGGRTVEWDALVLATGAAARRLPEAPPHGVHVLRTLADAARLRAELEPRTRLVVIGAGFVGTEVASTARSLGVDVTLVDVVPRPLARILGDDVGDLLARRYGESGVVLRLGVGVARLRANAAGRVDGVELADGSMIPCDAVVVGIGVRPEAPDVALERAQDGGIVTDASGRTAVPGVYACGDVAHAWHPLLGRHLRVEHWTSAARQGAAVAAAILGEEEPRPELPYFWSDQFGLRLQYVGHADDWAAVDFEGDEESFAVRYLDVDGRPLAALLGNRPRALGALRRELAGAALADAA
jgi:NADPH-dependent 2,4-dienoyl-CoA reductase/sulfur reductase-like enzyme